MPVDVPEDPNGDVLSGRDLRGGGTWLGISRTGKVAFLYVHRLSRTALAGLGRARDADPTRWQDEHLGGGWAVQLDAGRADILPAAPRSRERDAAGACLSDDH